MRRAFQALNGVSSILITRSKLLILRNLIMYNGSEKHLENLANARFKSLVRNVECSICKEMFPKSGIKQHEMSCANKRPCPTCGKMTTNPKYCSKSCSAKNQSRKQTEETKIKISKSVKANISKTNRSNINIKTHSKVRFVSCSYCNKTYVVRNHYKDYRKTCSENCKVAMIFKDRTYVNGKRKTIPYFCKEVNQIVSLESSWELEVAKFLDSLNVKWIRPKFILWVDRKGKNRRYFPDFYLPDYDLYLDPKNEYCMEIDKDKLECVGKKINLISGDVELIKYTCLDIIGV